MGTLDSLDRAELCALARGEGEGGKMEDFHLAAASGGSPKRDGRAT